mmetsp:Transcript_23226/g.65969  ORF Transcript_23226/g.65969 Transcript_23226/m.65969 type:complete len:227 (+) Transcript_23226:1077-1757(+)
MALVRLEEPRKPGGAAFQNGLRVQGPRGARDQVPHHGEGAGALAEERHPAGIPAEACNIVLYPLQGRTLVAQGHVPSGSVRVFGPQGVAGEEPEAIEPVVHRHHHDVVPARQSRPIVGGLSQDHLIRITHDVGPTEYPNHDWEQVLRPNSRCGRVHVQVQAVLALTPRIALRAILVHVCRAPLVADAGPPCRQQRLRPGSRQGLRCTEPVLPNWRLCEGNSPEGAH